MTLEQHGLEAHGATYAQIPFDSKYYRNWSAVGWIHGFGTVDTEELHYVEGRLQVTLEFSTMWRAGAPNLPNCSRANCSHVLLLKTFPSLGFQNPFTWLSFPSLPIKFSSLTDFKILECPWVQSSATFSLYASSSSYDLILSQNTI